MRIAIFGSGGVGGYFGGRLAQAGEEVIFIARGDHLKAMRASGLRVDSIKGDFAIASVQATDTPVNVGAVEAVLVCVKAWQVTEAAQAIQPLIGPETIVIPLENGVEAPDQLAGVLGWEHVLGGLCHIVSFIAAPGHIRHTGIEPHVAFGWMDGQRNTRAEQLRKAFERAGVWAEIPADIQAALWEKFLFIASASGVGAVARAPMGVLRSLPETRHLLRQAMQEIYAVARARGISLIDAVVEKTLAFVDGLPAGATTSMQRDIMEGRPSELANQNGAVVRLGVQAGVDTPAHAFIYSVLLPQELRARQESA